MRLPNWFWPRQSNPDNGPAIRLGRAFHWILAMIGAAMMVVAAIMGVSAVLSGATSAQHTASYNEVRQEQSVSEPNPFDKFDTNSSADQRRKSTYPRSSVLGSYAREDQGAVAVLPTLQDLPKRSSIDWALLQAAGAVFIVGLLLMLFGRAIRYILSNE